MAHVLSYGYRGSYPPQSPFRRPILLIWLPSSLSRSRSGSPLCHRRAAATLSLGSSLAVAVNTFLVFVAWGQKDLALSRAAVVATRLSHTPRPCAIMEAAKSSVSLLSGGFAQSLIGIESPTARRPRVCYSGIGIEWAIGCSSTPSAGPIG